MKTYTSKRLKACEVHHVVRKGQKGFPVSLSARNYIALDSSDRYWFFFDGKYLHLPKRKRGEKYVVRYTEMKQVEL